MLFRRSARAAFSFARRFSSSRLAFLSLMICCSASRRCCVSSRFSAAARPATSSRSPRAHSACLSASRSRVSISRRSSAMRSASAALSAFMRARLSSIPFILSRDRSWALSREARAASTSARCPASSILRDASRASRRERSPRKSPAPATSISITGRAQTEWLSTRFTSSSFAAFMVCLSTGLEETAAASPLPPFELLPEDGSAPLPSADWETGTWAVMLAVRLTRPASIWSRKACSPKRRKMAL
mmetsp:Transcript_12600/g.35400  ORF Transcript_12600/g.35400 Transcript_12600/m.35400 type:complete len:245 (-) Transcript_12600:1412-2146(-)